MTDRYTLHHGNSLHILTELDDQSIDSIVTDPPYELGFMGKKWDASGIAYSVDLWTECLRVLKPGGHLLAFGGTRTYHRMAVAIEDAGFEIRDSIHWLYGSGFPKSHDVSKAIDKQAGAKRERVPFIGGIAPGSNNYVGNGTVHVGTKVGPVPLTDEAKQWEGWGTALKPAHEPIVLARKPLDGTVANNVLQHGTGALNIDRTRVTAPDEIKQMSGKAILCGSSDGWDRPWKSDPEALVARQERANIAVEKANTLGRWPANIIIDDWIADIEDDWPRYFYCAKPSRAERNAGLNGLPERDACDGPEGQLGANMGSKSGPRQNFHPTVKPLALIRYLIRLITPPAGIVLDPFAGSGTTLAAAILEGHHAIGIELTDDYLPIIHGRCQHAITQHDNQPQQEPTLFDNHDN